MPLTLERLGFFRNMIVETIISTYDVKGRPNAAPMGVMAVEPRKVVIRPFKSSSTYKNLVKSRCAVVNVTSDPVLFFYTAFKEVNPGGLLPSKWFRKARIVNAPRLIMADATVEVSVSHVKLLNSMVAEALCDVKFVSAAKVLPRAYCRAYFAVIESIIHATRIKSFLTSDTQRREEATQLVDLIKHHYEVVRKVAPNSKYLEIIANLIKMQSHEGLNENLH